MNSSATTPGVQPPGSTPDDEDVIKAIPLRHPVRLLCAILVLAAVAIFLYDAATNRPAYQWDIVGKYVFDRRISRAAMITLSLTALSMFFAILLAVALAIMRLSPNPVLKSVAWGYLWIFRGTPVYVQLVFWGLFPTIYQSIFLGIPLTHIGFDISPQSAISLYWWAVIGLALNEAAYMAEIVRAGLLSVDPGQEEAATALGLSWWQTMRRIILPQAMRVIIPPTGNEVISMLKTTSLVTAVPYSMDLYTRTRDISGENFAPVSMLIVASIWYVFFTSILMIGQYFLERHYARGTRHVELGGVQGEPNPIIAPNHQGGPA
ncbi:MAG: amino acid ABC transporter permease [Nocardioides sp.]|uniref:amino acid ABC transporter permease n=1 Tax=Nocardioides sp. TaxID=35761 RepID=UPI0039E286EE